MRNLVRTVRLRRFWILVLVSGACVLASCGSEELQPETGVLRGPSTARPANEPKTPPPVTDRAVLAERLRAAGLSGDIAKRAVMGLHLVRTTEAVRSRLGGRGLLPKGAKWPYHGRGRPLSFLAAIDLAEARAAGGDSRLPARGTLLFFADLANDEAEGFIDESGNRPGSAARAYYVRSSTPLVSPKPPAALGQARGLVLDEQPVKFEARLTLDDSFDAATRLKLKGTKAKAYQRVVSSLLPPYGFSGGPHWVGGLITGAQGYYTPPSSVLLLHLNNDEALGFEFLDAGTAQFRISAKALKRRQWSKVVAVADSA